MQFIQFSIMDPVSNAHRLRVIQVAVKFYVSDSRGIPTSVGSVADSAISAGPHHDA
jgi:hypothetical protein